MAILAPAPAPATTKKSDRNRETFRLYPVTIKLTKEEREAVTRFAESHGAARGQWMRDAILAQLQNPSKNNAALAEVLGIRLLLVNVLRPLAAGQKLTQAAFDKLLDRWLAHPWPQALLQRP